MTITVSEAIAILKERGLVGDRGIKLDKTVDRNTPPEPVVLFRTTQPECVIPYVQALVGRQLPNDLIELYQSGIEQIGEHQTIVPVWNDYVGWRTPDSLVTELAHLDFIPIFSDSGGNTIAIDLTPQADAPGIYFFDHEEDFEAPNYAVGSSLGAFFLLAVAEDQAFEEEWPDKWQLEIDPDIDKCPRAPAIWNAG